MIKDDALCYHNPTISNPSAQIHKGGNYLAQNEKDFWSLLWFTLVYFTLVTLSAETLLETKKTPQGLFVQIQILEENIRMDIGFPPFLCKNHSTLSSSF